MIITTFQQNLPVFVRSQYRPFVWGKNKYEMNEMVPWLELGVPQEKIEILFKAGFLYHNTDLEKDLKVGDRLSEMNKAQLDSLVNLLNTEVKKRTSSTDEFNKKKCKKSRLEDKQRALVRQFLYRSPWINERFYEIRDKILGEVSQDTE